MPRRASFRLALACALLGCLTLGRGEASSQPPIFDGLGAGLSHAPASDDLTAVEGQVVAARSRRARVDAEIEGLIGQRDGARQRVRNRVRALYRLRRAGVLPLAGGFEALLRHVGRVDRLERMVSRDVVALSTLSRRVSALSEETSRLADEVAVAERHAASARLRQSEQARQMRILGTMIEDPTSFGGAGGFGVRYTDGSTSAGFASNRGALSLPVGGSATVSEAQREGGQGLELTAAAGIRVRAVAAGRVAYAAPHAAYGLLVIVEHDDSYFTVYGGLDALAVGPGHSVASDAVLGSVGAQPVFFQVRRGSRPLPARAWLGI